MKNILLIIIYLLIDTVYPFAQFGWILQNPEIDKQISKIYFINSNTGWASASGSLTFVSAGYFIKTTNGGQNWTTILNTLLQYKDFTFIDDNTGWLIGHYYNDLGAQIRYIFKSTNSGNNWAVQFTDTLQPSFNSVFFLNVNTGWVAGPFGSIYKTTNSGNTWFSQSISNTSHISAILFLNENTGWCAGTAGDGIILFTSNGGYNWTLQESIANRVFNNVYFTNQNTGWAVGSNGIAVKTTNAGVNWQLQSVPVNQSLFSLNFINDQTGWICGAIGAILYTSNGGLNWDYQITNTTNELKSVCFINSTTGWAAGGLSYVTYPACIIKTTTSGLTFLDPISEELPDNFILSQNFPNPFNPITKIKFDIKKLGDVKLIIYDILGKEITTLVNEQLQPGTYEAEWNASNFASGVYFYKLITEGYTETRKMVLIK